MDAKYFKTEIRLFVHSLWILVVCRFIARICFLIISKSVRLVRLNLIPRNMYFSYFSICWFIHFFIIAIENISLVSTFNTRMCDESFYLFISIGIAVFPSSCLSFGQFFVNWATNGDIFNMYWCPDPVPCCHKFHIYKKEKNQIPVWINIKCLSSVFVIMRRTTEWRMTRSKTKQNNSNAYATIK